jgi:hypothetical protein
MTGQKLLRLAGVLGAWAVFSCSGDDAITSDLGHDLARPGDARAKDFAAIDHRGDTPLLQHDLSLDQTPLVFDQSARDLPLDASAYYPTPVAYWTMDSADMVNGSIQDHVGQNHGTLSATTSDNAGQVGQAIALDGNKSYIDFQEVLNGTFGGADKAFSISLWIKPTANQENNILLAKSADTACDPDETQRMWLTSLKTQGKAAFSYQTPQAGNVHIIGGTTPVSAPGTWTHLLFVYDGSMDSAPSDRVSLYVNGATDTKTATSSGSFPFDLQPSSAHLAFGVRLSSTGAPCAQSGAQYFQGAVDELALWNTALTPAAATAVYQRGLGKSRLVP